MPRHLRFKRHLRFLQEGDVVRVIGDLGDSATLPAGVAFDHLLAAIRTAPTAESLTASLANRLGVTHTLVAALVDRLSELKLIEYFEPENVHEVRFDRQLLLFDVLAPVADHQQSLERQLRLQNANVLILGLGGIGNQVAQSLAAAGVGSLVLVDGDIVEETNLHRQILFRNADVGRPKISAAYDAILRIAPNCNVIGKNAFIRSAEDWKAMMTTLPSVAHVMLSADKPVELVNWLSDARITHGYHFIKCGYMGTQGLIGPLLGPDTCGYEDLFHSWGNLVASQPEHIAKFNAESVAPTMAASNAILANMATLELIKHITGAGALSLLEQRLLLDLNDYTTKIG